MVSPKLAELIAACKSPPAGTTIVAADAALDVTNRQASNRQTFSERLKFELTSILGKDGWTNGNIQGPHFGNRTISSRSAGDS
jgi:hypothetical protein